MTTQSVWHRISEQPIPEDEAVLVGWWFKTAEFGSWEIDTDPYNDCATHWALQPLPPYEELQTNSA